MQEPHAYGQSRKYHCICKSETSLRHSPADTVSLYRHIRERKIMQPKLHGLDGWSATFRRASSKMKTTVGAAAIMVLRKS